MNSRQTASQRRAAEAEKAQRRDMANCIALAVVALCAFSGLLWITTDDEPPLIRTRVCYYMDGTSGDC